MLIKKLVEQIVPSGMQVKVKINMHTPERIIIEVFIKAAYLVSTKKKKTNYLSLLLNM